MSIHHVFSSVTRRSDIHDLNFSTQPIEKEHWASGDLQFAKLKIQPEGGLASSFLTAG